MSDADASNIVIDKGQSKLSDLWTKEDYWAIWLGLAIIVAAIFLFLVNPPADYRQKIDKANAVMAAEAQRAPFKTIAWYKAQDDKSRIRARDSAMGKAIAGIMKTPQGWVSNPMDSLVLSKADADAKAAANADKAASSKAAAESAMAAAVAAEKAAGDAAFADASLNADAQAKIAQWRAAAAKAKSAADKAKSSPFNLMTSLPLIMVAASLLFAIGMKAMGRDVPRFLLGFVGVFAVACLAFMMGQQSTMKYWGVGAEAWAIIIGMVIANTVGTPRWIHPALQVEFFIKTGLVLLGAEVLFDKIVAIGVPGIFMTWVGTPIVLIGTYIFGQRVLRLHSKTLNMVICADMSVCGTSAAIATAAACRAKKEELTLAIGLSLVFTAIMMIAMPAFIKAVDMPQVLAGAWMGGTIDATGAVAAAGAFLGETALHVAATIKMIQNVLIGVVAFGVAVYWCTRVECSAGKTASVADIWHRFPKFVLGFLGVSIMFSIISGSLGPDMGQALLDQGAIRGLTSPARNWFFCLAFAAIGLETNFRELAHYLQGGKALALYVVGQTFNLVMALTLAYIMFYVLFPEITAKI
ncbi:YeiH family protein [Nitratidesulfovibrio sp. SRB-5]|uniref:YeiH family protein n=1 Tax=Nitratidesulfovibrio sp. SRB-5 TaxID=2872636 RepID=UPI001027090D|nr:putative sulfate exporter family transporter [Nitratidesulfovibrio sp. SRB-5]MBZ2172480.1 YeiH family protein [Nitratidesulfovibrio sp. SRB-5]RXF77779.1 putative sulfate exporter family transporter [Desulfovibrio sp. DS-1]